MSSSRTYADIKNDLTKILDEYDSNTNPDPSTATSTLNRFWSHVSSGGTWKGRTGRHFSAELRKVLEEEHVEPSIVLLKRMFDVAYQHNNATWFNSDLSLAFIEHIAKEMKMKRILYPVVESGGLGVPMGAGVAREMLENNDDFFKRISQRLDRDSVQIPLKDSPRKPN